GDFRLRDGASTRVGGEQRRLRALHRICIRHGYRPSGHVALRIQRSAPGVRKRSAFPAAIPGILKVMKVPCSWLADWVDVPWEATELGSRLTMAGFELDGLEPAAPPFSGVIVAEILSAERHPQADKLQVCRVSTGSGEPLQIVCGAANARAGLK